jgi:arginine:pyruvate transaminase
MHSCTAGSLAWELHDRATAARDAGADVIVLSAGEPDHPPCAAAVAHARDGLARGVHPYTPWKQGIPALRSAIARYHHRAFGVAADGAEVVVTTGTQGALQGAMMCLAGPGDEVLVPEPMYTTYEALVAITGARAVPVPLRPERRFNLDPADVERRVTPSTRALLLNNPQNPTGAVLDRTTLTEICRVIRQHDMWLISDEVYAPFTYEGDHVSPASLPGMRERTLILNSISKSHALPGWRIGWAIAPRELAAHLTRVALCTHFGLPIFLQDAAAVALDEGDDAIHRMRAVYRARRDLVVSRVRALHPLSCLRPDGALYVLIDIAGTGMTSARFCEALYERHRLALLSGDGFGACLEGYVRWSLTAREDVLEDALARLARFVSTMPRAGLQHR